MKTVVSAVTNPYSSDISGFLVTLPFQVYIVSLETKKEAITCINITGRPVHKATVGNVLFSCFCLPGFGLLGAATAAPLPPARLDSATL